MALYRATDALNMIPDAIGQIRKRPGVQIMGDELGCEILQEIEGRCRVLGKNPFNGIGIPTLLYYDSGTSEYVELFSCWNDILLIPHGEKVFAFAWQFPATNAEYPTGFGKVHGEDDYNSLFAVLEKDGAYIYTDDEIRYTYYTYEEEKWGSGPTPADDPRLTVPRMFLGCKYTGGGTAHEPANLLNPWVVEEFCLIGPLERVFVLNDLVTTETVEDDRIRGDDLNQYFKVEVLTEVPVSDEENSDTALEWVERSFAAKDTYRVSKNWLWLPDFSSPTPQEGVDNLRITHRRAEFKARMNQLCKATCAAFYGVGGYKDRLFLGVKNRIYYSELSDPLYIGDLNFIELDSEKKVEILSGIANNLAIITGDGVYFAAGQVSNGEDGLYATDALFTLSNRISAPAPISGSGAAVLGGEIVYLSKEGVIAVTSKDEYSERYAEHRSATINKKMLADGPRFLCSFGRYLLIFCKDDICWLLDENQPNTEGDKPYSAHQYEGYRMSGFGASCAYQSSDGRLIFAREGGLYEWKSGESADHYQDIVMEGASGTEDGRYKTTKAINAYWETPWITGTKFYLRKTFRRLGILLDPIKGIDMAIQVEGKKNDEDWKVLLNYDGRLCTLKNDYSLIDYRFFSYSTEQGDPTIKKKIRIKKAVRFKLRFTNKIINQTLILNQCGLDYVQED